MLLRGINLEKLNYTLNGCNVVENSETTTCIRTYEW